MKLVKLIFKLHKFIYKYPCKSEVRLVLEQTKNHPYGLTYFVSILYTCGESIENISEWIGVDEDKVKQVLNELVGE